MTIRTKLSHTESLWVGSGPGGGFVRSWSHKSPLHEADTTHAAHANQHRCYVVKSNTHDQESGETLTIMRNMYRKAINRSFKGFFSMCDCPQVQEYQA